MKRIAGHRYGRALLLGFLMGCALVAMTAPLLAQGTTPGRVEQELTPIFETIVAIIVGWFFRILAFIAILVGVWRAVANKELGFGAICIGGAIVLALLPELVSNWFGG